MTVQMTGARHGDQDRQHVLAMLFEHNHRQLVRLAGVLVGEAGAAEEIVQEAYVRLHRSLPSLAREKAARAYLRTTVVNLSRSKLRRRAVERRHAPGEAGAGASAEERAVRGDDRRAVMEALAQLPRRQRECVVLRYYAELSNREIAETVGISQSSVQTHLQRAMAALAQRLEGRR